MIIMFNTCIAPFTCTYDQKRFTKCKITYSIKHYMTK